MPSPVAHGIAGTALAIAVIRYGFVDREWWFWIGAIVFAANAPDLDFVPGIFVGEPGLFHHGPTHTLFASALFGFAAWAAARIAGRALPRRFGVLMGLGYLSHVLLDFLTIDTRAPYGMALFWPVVTRNVESPIQVFLEIWTAGRRTFWLSLLQWHNVIAMVRELFVMSGLLGAIWVVASVLRRRPGAAANGPERSAR